MSPRVTVGTGRDDAVRTRTECTYRRSTEANVAAAEVASRPSLKHLDSRCVESNMQLSCTQRTRSCFTVAVLIKMGQARELGNERYAFPEQEVFEAYGERAAPDHCSQVDGSARTRINRIKNSVDAARSSRPAANAGCMLVKS